VGSIVALHRSEGHGFSKASVAEVELLAGVGIAGDAHAGPLVQHRSRVAVDPSQPNLRQVHLIGRELLDALAEAGHAVAPGELGENVTTSGIDLHHLAAGSVVRLGDSALVAVTGLRNPCAQIDAFQPGLLRRLRIPTEAGGWMLRAGVMGVVVVGGTVRAGDAIEVSAPPGPPRPLERV
jgi:MOSC domain-containing protein YiiM